jgi:antitoxin ParD1/3/4
MSIILKPEQERVVQTLLAEGDFQDADEVLRSALALLAAEHRAYQQWLAETRVKVEVGIASLERGEGVDGETFVAQLLQRIQG